MEYSNKVYKNIRWFVIICITQIIKMSLRMKENSVDSISAKG